MTELRIVQYYIPNDSGPNISTRYTIQQNINGHWTELPVVMHEETDPSILEQFERTPVVRTDEASDGQG